MYLLLLPPASFCCCCLQRPRDAGLAGNYMWVKAAKLQPHTKPNICPMLLLLPPAAAACSDPVTQAWLADHCDAVFGFLPLVRFSWETCSR
jgi:hypothetical protein